MTIKGSKQKLSNYRFLTPKHLGMRQGLDHSPGVYIAKHRAKTYTEYMVTLDYKKLQNGVLREFTLSTASQDATIEIIPDIQVAAPQ